MLQRDNNHSERALEVYLASQRREPLPLAPDYWDEVPSNGHGINSERRPRRILQSRPYDYPELLSNWAGLDAEKKLAAERMRRDIAVTHQRLASHPWRQTLIQGEVDFSDLRLGSFVLHLPSVEEYRQILRSKGIALQDVTPRTIRDINYALVEEALCERYGLSPRKGRNFIGNALNGVIHEDLAGFAYIVPRNTHDEFKHRGYVEYILRSL